MGTLAGIVILGGVLSVVPRPAPTQPAEAPQDEVRAIYVPAPSAPLTDPMAAEQMLQDARAAKFNTVIVQVRALGDAYYNSDLVPEAVTVTPAYPDPLAWILDKAKNPTDPTAPKLRVIAALETLRVHSMTVRSRPAPGSVLDHHPEWATQSIDNKAVGPDQYLSLEPGLESVRGHLADVVRELATNYELDGIYLDGIRYPGTSAKWGYNPAVLQEFRDANPGQPDRPGPTDPKWIDFRKGVLETLATDLAGAIHQVRPACRVYVAGEVQGPAPATLEDWEEGPVASGMMQDWVAWGRKGLADWVCVKNFQAGSTQRSQFDGWLGFVTRAGIQSRLAMGIYGSENFNTQVLNQVRAVQTAGFAGVALFDYQNPSAEDRASLMTFLGNTVFAQQRQVVKLMNITYVPPVTATPQPTEFTTPTLVMAGATTATLPTQTPFVEEIEEEEPTPEPTPVPEMTAVMETEPEPTATPPPPMPTPTPLAAPMQTFRLKNGLSFKGRVVVEMDDKVTILTEDGAQLKIPRNQILSPVLE